MPAPRTGYAFVRVNGEDYGLYLNVETLDEHLAAALVRDRRSTSTRANTGPTSTAGGAGAFEVDEGDEDDLADLEALIAAANDERGDWSRRGWPRSPTSSR